MDRAAAIRRVGLVILGANAALLAAKGVVWYTTGSLAVGSEAVNSLADTVYSVVVLGGLYVTTQPPDPNHPHGHERIEPFVSLFVAAGIIVAAVVVFGGAVLSVLSGTVSPSAGLPGIAVLGVAAVVKYGLYRQCLRVGQTFNSPAITAAALDNRADILTAGAALVGVVGAMVGVPVLDPLAAMAVALGIFYSGVDVITDNVNYLVGRAPPPELTEEIVKRALAHPSVHGVHDVVAHYVGPEVDVSLHVEVAEVTTLATAHDIESAVTRAIRDIPEIDDVFVHLDPKELGEWKKDESPEP